jgi:hypothetical protein
LTRYAPQWLQSGSYAASQDRRLIGAVWPAPASAGCAVTASSAMTVTVAPGQVAVPTQNNTGTTLCSSDATEAVTLTAAPSSGTNRIDVITCHPRGNDLDGGANNDFIFDFVTGTAAATPTVPATPAGQVALAQIYVPGGSAAVTAGNITDVRPGGLAIASSVAPTSAPRGTLAQAMQTSSSPTTTTSVTWFSAPAVTVDGTRRIKVSYTGFLNAGTANDLIGIRLMDGATTLQGAQSKLSTTGGTGQTSVSSVWQGVPAAGAHTYSLQVLLLAGTGPATGTASSANPATLLVEDIGT